MSLIETGRADEIVRTISSEYHRITGATCSPILTETFRGCENSGVSEQGHSHFENSNCESAPSRLCHRSAGLRTAFAVHCGIAD